MPETITLESDRSFRSSRHDLSNTIIDANNHELSITIDSGGKWSNFAIIGRPKADGHMIDINKNGQSFTFERYYIGPSAAGGNSEAYGCHAAVFQHPYDKGTMTFRNGFVTGWWQSHYTSNAGNPPGNEPKRLPGRGGSIHFENVVVEKFSHTAFRIGLDASTIKNCVARDAYNEASRRAAWIYQTGGQIEGLHFDGSTSGISIGSLYDRDPNPRIDDCYGPSGDQIHGRYHGSGIVGRPDISDPSGVPTSPEAAASGPPRDTDSGGDERPEGVRYFMIDGREIPKGERVQYRLVGNATRVNPGPMANMQAGERRIDERTVEGEVAGGRDDWWIHSMTEPHVTSLELRGSQEALSRVRIYLEDVDVSDAPFVEKLVREEPPPDTGDPDIPNDTEPTEPGPDPEPEPEPNPVESRRLYVYGDEWAPESERTDTDDHVWYTIAVDGDIELGDKADEWDEIDHFEGAKVVTGSVPANGDDAFELFGDVRWVHGPQPRLNWQLNREPWDPPYRTRDPREDNPDESELPIEPPPDDPEPPIDPGDGSQGPNPDYLNEYDHYLEINDQAGDDIKVRYHFVVTGEIVTADTGDVVDNRGWFGHADGVVSGYRDGYYYTGSLLAIYTSPSLGEYRIREHDSSLEWNDMPFGVFVDGIRENHEEYNPLDATRRGAGLPTTDSLPMGYAPGGIEVSGGGKPTGMRQPSPETAEWLFDSWRDFASLNDSDLKPGHTVLFDASNLDGRNIDFPQVGGTLRQFSTDCVTFSCTPRTRITTPSPAPDRWANTGIRLDGKHSSIINMSYHGGEKTPQPYSGSASVGLELAGHYPVALNTRVSYWGQVGLQCSGIGETILSTQAHRCHTKGSGYGIASSGTVGKKDWDAGETWTEEELNTVRPWHERTQIKFFDISHCRHHVERGNNTTTELGWGLLHPTNEWSGTFDDIHRPARGESNHHDYVVQRDAQNPAHGTWIRGRPRLIRANNIWYKGWSADKYGHEVRIRERYPDRQAPFVQVCATNDSYDRRNTFDRSSGPFLTGLGNNPETNDPLVWQVERTQIGGSKPDWLFGEVAELVDRRT